MLAEIYRTKLRKQMWQRAGWKSSDNATERNMATYLPEIIVQCYGNKRGNVPAGNHRTMLRKETLQRACRKLMDNATERSVATWLLEIIGQCCGKKRCNVPAGN